jgi:hypothetical protein
MSKATPAPMRVAFVMEGPTDYVVLKAAVRALLKGRDFVPTPVKPELNQNLIPTTEGGWGGVYKWCRQAVSQSGGSFRNNPILAFHDALVIQIDADVAEKRYSDYHIADAPCDDLPCIQADQSTGQTVDALRQVMLGWLSETAVPTGSVLCIPSKSIETWLLVALFPADDVAVRADVESRKDVEIRLRKHGLIKGKQKLIEKYKANETKVHNAWSTVRAKCPEADRFSTAFLNLVPAIMT